jgi:hypothetical protein
MTPRNSVGFVVLTAMVMKNSVFWDITPYSPLKVHRRCCYRLGLFFDPEYEGTYLSVTSVDFQQNSSPTDSILISV